MINIITDSHRANFIPTWLYVKQHTITKKLYFGKTTVKNPISYRGSGAYWRNHIKKHGKNDIITIWHLLFDNIDVLVKFAITFSEEMNIVESKYWANQIIETGLDNNLGSHLSANHKKHLSNIRKGTTVFVDNKGNKINTNITDPRVLSGELKGHTSGKSIVLNTETNTWERVTTGTTLQDKKYIGNRKGYTTFIDNTGKTYGCRLDDPRILSGELFGINSGKANYVDKNGVSFYVENTDLRVLSGELKSNNCGKGMYKDIHGNIIKCDISDYRVSSGELVSINEGRTNFKDRDGNIIKCSVDDPRVYPGNWWVWEKGSVSIRIEMAINVNYRKMILECYLENSLE